MKLLDCKLYKSLILKGKEDVAQEWMEFLSDNAEEGSRILKEEKGHLEAYFISEENGDLYLYLFFSSEDVDASNEIASKSTHELDVKHFAYMQECVDFDKSMVLDCKCQMNVLLQ